MCCWGQECAQLGLADCQPSAHSGELSGGAGTLARVTVAHPNWFTPAASWVTAKTAKPSASAYSRSGGLSKSPVSA